MNATEALTKYIITDMHAKAVQGNHPRRLRQVGELKKVYEG